MPQYLFTARDSLGNEVTDYVEAPTVDGARYGLETRRYTDITFHTDDSSNRIDEAIRRETGAPPSEEVMTPEQTLAARQRGGVLSEVWSVVQLTTFFWLPLSVWCAVSLVQGKPYGWGDWLGFALAGLFCIWFVWLVAPGVAYQRLQEASVWNRELETRFWAGVLRGLRKIGNHAVIELELDVRLATVLARNRKLEEMKRIIGRHQGTPENGMMIQGRIAGIMDAAGEHEEAHRLRTQFCETSGNDMVAVVDHALGLIRHLRRADEAEASLARVLDREQNAIARIFVVYTTALIALERQQYESALKLLKETERLSLPIRNPGMNGLRKDIMAFQAICLSGLGRLPEARQLSRACLPLLKARKDLALIRRLQEALG